jgi:SAM-dependent methyltransferase
MRTTTDSPSADRHPLFDDSPSYTSGPPLLNGFYELERPDNWRWILPEAECRLPRPGGRLARPALLVRALPGRFKWMAYLSVFVNGVYVETQAVPAYGSYWFELEPTILDGAGEGELTVSLRVNNAEQEAGGLRKLALAVYELRLIDLDASVRFEERDLFLEQLTVFDEPKGLSRALRETGLGPQTRILDVGAGLGWSSVLLALFSGAQVVAVDMHQYDAPTGVAFKAELRRRLSRHFSELRRAKAFAQIGDMADVERAIDRCTFLTMNAEDLLLRDNLFDFVFSLNSFEHIPHPDRALEEIRRTLRPGGEAFIAFSPAYYSDRGHHLHSSDLLDLPWVHLLHSREEIKRMISDRGKPTNEVDAILNTLNGWRASQFQTMYRESGLEVVSHGVQTGFSIPGAKESDAFRTVSKRFPMEDLTTVGMQTHLRKSLLKER